MKEEARTIITSYEHLGYVLQQSSYNWHYMIFNSKGRVVLHSQYGEKLTEEEAKKRIDDYIQMMQELR